MPHRSEPGKATPVGIQQVALEVENVGEALKFYGKILDITLQDREPGFARISLGNQSLILTEGRTQTYDTHRYLGLLIDDKDLIRKALHATGAEVLYGESLDFLDPWGNRIKIAEAGNGPSAPDGT